MTGKVSERLWKNRSKRAWGVGNAPPEGPTGQPNPKSLLPHLDQQCGNVLSKLSIVLNHRSICYCRLIKTTIITTLN